MVTDIATAGHALAYIVVANRRHTDLFEWGQRSAPFSLAAEIQRRLLPGAFTCEAGQFTVAGWLEPASSVAGDTFDYTLDQHSLQVSITTRSGTTWPRPCWPRCWSAACATSGGAAPAWVSRCATPATRWPGTPRSGSS
jgi:hypothetical protein